ncbi:MAG: hypothetical protein IPK97_20900 [Ahniella sp.]|nr:hypothetical protein [Ahniella sp.]
MILKRYWLVRYRDPSARYASVMEFADELGRVLDDLPVLARAGTAAATRFDWRVANVLPWRWARLHCCLWQF